MGTRAKLVCFGGAVPVALMFAHGCKGPTQVTIDLRTNVVCADLRGIDIVAAGEPRRAEERAALVNGGPRFPSASTNECTEGTLPRRVGTLVVTPNGDAGAVVVVSAFGTAKLDDCIAPNFASQCIVARRRFAFIEGRQLTLPIVLDPECAGVPCNESSTCVGKKCVDSEVKCTGDVCSDPGIGADGGLIVVDGSSPFIDATPPVGDSGPSDGSSGDASDDADAAGDSGGDAGGDAGGGASCPGVDSCLPIGRQPGIACTSTSKCCYATGAATCQPVSGTGSCGGTEACCHGSSVCPTNTFCCADTIDNRAGTRIACRPQAECMKRVCSSADMDCRGQGQCDMGAPYSIGPNFFACS